MTFRVEPLGDRHDLEGFDCENASLNDWLQRHARHATRQGTRSYLLVSDDTHEIAGYFAIAAHLIERDEIPTKVGRGAPRQIPAILLAKLASNAPTMARASAANCSSEPSKPSSPPPEQPAGTRRRRRHRRQRHPLLPAP